MVAVSVGSEGSSVASRMSGGRGVTVRVGAWVGSEVKVKVRAESEIVEERVRKGMDMEADRFTANKGGVSQPGSPHRCIRQGNKIADIPFPSPSG